MNKQSRVKLIGILIVCLFMIGCATEGVPQETHVGEHKSYHYVVVLSDPPGAHVYGEDGSYWGMTEEEQGVVRLFERDLNWDTTDQVWRWKTGASGRYTITLKKRGYQPTTHSFVFPQHFKMYMGSPEELKATGYLAKVHPQTEITKLLVVLNTE